MPNENQGVIIEFTTQGAYVRVSAFDPATLTEVTIVGAANAPRAHLETIVIRKLRQRIDRERTK